MFILTEYVLFSFNKHIYSSRGPIFVFFLVQLLYSFSFSVTNMIRVHIKHAGMTGLLQVLHD